MFHQACEVMVICPSLLANQPRVSGQLWHFSGSQEEEMFGECGVGGLSVGRDCRLLELQEAGGEKILGAQFRTGPPSGPRQEIFSFSPSLPTTTGSWEN